MIRVQENNGFKPNPAIELDIRFRKEFQLFTNEFNPFSMSTIDKHDIGFQLRLTTMINLSQEIIHNRLFPRTRRTIENNMGNSIRNIKRM